MRRILVGALIFAAACSSDSSSNTPGGGGGGGTADAAVSSSDSGVATVDSGSAAADAGLQDSLPADTGAVVDSGVPPDSGIPPDTGVPDDSGVHPDAAAPPEFRFFTPAWMDGEMVPAQYTCAVGGFGHQFNPEIAWENPPPGTAGFVMIFDDPDARNFPHWAFYTFDTTLRGIPEGTSNTANLPAGVVELDGNRVGYVPNCPGGRFHTYRWRLWAVNTNQLGVSPRSSFRQLEAAAAANAIEMRSFSGRSNASPP